LLEDRKRISDEIALLKKLKHPNIISFISAWINKQKEEIVFITEVVTGGSLKK
jgi:WNK lysine deficient protein kinase